MLCHLRVPQKCGHQGSPGWASWTGVPALRADGLVAGLACVPPRRRQPSRGRSQPAFVLAAPSPSFVGEDLNTCECVHTHTGVCESEQGHWL